MLSLRKHVVPHQPALASRRRTILRTSVAATAAGKNVVVVGSGWAGLGACKHLTEQGYRVVLLDAQANPGGLSTGFRTKGGQTVEAGTKGFWFTYRNLFKLIDELQLPEFPLTPFTTSGFWSPRGLTTEAPVFSQLPRLPTLVGQFVTNCGAIPYPDCVHTRPEGVCMVQQHTAPLYWNLSLSDRLTMLPFLTAFLDYTSSEEVAKKYDSMSAYELFRSMGVSRQAYEQFLRPTLLVGLFAPPEEISALVMLETLWFYALAHQNDFDVCWCRGSIAERILTPLVDKLRGQGAQILGNKLVTNFVTEGGDIYAVEAKDKETGEAMVYEADAVVLAVGVTAMQRLVSANPVLAAQPEFRAIMNLSSLDVMATRIFFDRIVPTRYPANVLSGFEPSAGATFFNLNDLQDEYKNSRGTVVSADFYNASALLPLSDEEIVARVKSHISECEPGFKDAVVTDYSVLRYPKSVTHFKPGSYSNRPYQATSVPNLFIAGDWVKGLDHGSNGLSQERAYVSGLTAANLVIARLGQGQPADIIPTEEDEPHIAAARGAIKQLRMVADGLGVRSPFLC